MTDNSSTSYLSKSAAVAQLCAAGVFASYADAREAGVFDDLDVAGVSPNMTTAARVAEVAAAASPTDVDSMTAKAA